MDDGIAQSVRRDHEAWHSKTETVFVGLDRLHMIVEAAIVVPGNDNRTIWPVLTLHYGIY